MAAVIATVARDRKRDPELADETADGPPWPPETIRTVTAGRPLRSHVNTVGARWLFLPTLRQNSHRSCRG